MLLKPDAARVKPDAACALRDAAGLSRARQVTRVYRKMLFFVCAWVTLLAVCRVAGAGALALLAGARREGDRLAGLEGDRLMLSVWLGLFILAHILLTASLFVPLTPAVGACVGAAVVAASLLSRAARAEAASLKSIPPRLLIGLLALALGVAAFASQPVTYYDTGLYHYGAIKWLSEYGAAPGVALVHSRFAFASTWFALAAPFDAWALEGRVAAVAGGFVTLVAVLHLVVCARRCAWGEARASDWLVVLSSALVLPAVVYWRMPVSASPDLPAILLASVVAWAMVVVSDVEEGRLSHTRSRLIPLLLAAGAAGVKLSALPLLFIACLFYAASGRVADAAGVRRAVRRLVVAAAAAFLLMLPLLAYGVVTSGCPLFPSGALCLNLPWFVGRGEAAHASAQILEWARWDGPAPPVANGWNWVGRWLTQGLTVKSAAAVPVCLLLAGAGAALAARARGRALGRVGCLVAALGCAGLLLFFIERAPNLLMVGVAAATVLALLAHGSDAFHAKGWVLFAGLSGVAVTLYAAPALRFGLGYTALLFACLLAPYASRLTRGARQDEARGRTRRGEHDEGKRSVGALAKLLFAFGLVFAALPFILGPGERRGATAGAVEPWSFGRLLLPPRLPEAATTARDVNGVKYLTPSAGDQCWSAPLPCAPAALPGDIEPRDPARGLASGFVHARRADVR